MQRNGKYYRRQAVSYIMILLIPVCAGIVFYFYTYHVVKGQTDISNRNYLINTQKTCDREFQYAQNCLVQLVMNGKIAEIYSDNEELIKKRDWNIASLCHEIQELDQSYCSDIFVYFKDQDVVASSKGRMDLDFYIDYFCTGHIEEADLLKASLLSEKPERILSMEAKWSQDHSSILILQPSLKKGKTSPAVIGIWMDVDVLSARIESGAWNENLEWAIVDEKEDVILCSRGVNGLAFRSEDLDEGGDFKLNWNRKEYLVRSLPSQNGNLKYVILMPENLITGVTGKVRNFFVVTNVLCLMVGVLISRYLMKLNYGPLRRLVELFSSSGEEGNGSGVENEYLYLEEKSRKLFEERSGFRQKMEYMNHVVEEYYLENLFRMPCGMLENTPELQKLKEMFQGKYCMVLLLKIEKYPAENEADRISTNNLRRFIIRNVFEEGIGEHYFQKTAYLGDTVAVAVRMNEEDVEAEIQETVEKYQDFIQKHFQFKVLAEAGSIHKGPEGIHLSYEEACQTEEFLALEDDDYISYRDIRTEAVNCYDYPVETEELIITAIVSGNGEYAVSMIEKILDTNMMLNRDAPEVFKCLLYNICATVRRAADRMGRNGTDIAGLSRISMKISIEDNKMILKQTVLDLTAGMEETGRNLETGMEVDRKTHQHHKLCQEILTYVKENYRDPDLNVAQTGLKFQMTPAYLSAILKKQTGKSLLTIINETRIKEAKRLLKQGVSVQETAVRTGFRDSSAFIRVFRKMVGVTPGQFQGIDKKENHS